MGENLFQQNKDFSVFNFENPKYLTKHITRNVLTISA